MIFIVADGTFRDKNIVDFENKILTKNRKTITLTGSENWELLYDKIERFRLDISGVQSDTSNITSLIANDLGIELGVTGATSSTPYKYTISSLDNKLYVSIVGDETLAEFQAKLLASPIVLQYTMVTPLEVDISNYIAGNIYKVYNKSIEYFDTTIAPYSKIEYIKIKSSDYDMNYLYVSADYVSADTGWGITKFNTIYDANDYISDNSESNRYTIIVAQGTYTDLQTKYSGTYSGVYEGVLCKDYVYYESEDINHPELCIITWDGATGFTTPVDHDEIIDKAPFHIVSSSNHTSIKGFTINGTNLRYAMHIETAGATEPVEYAIENCVFNWSGRPDQDALTNSVPVVGTGFTNGEIGKFINCEFNNIGITEYDNMIWQSHDNSANPTGVSVGETITFTNCLFSNVIDTFSQINPRTDINTSYEGCDINSSLTLNNCVGSSVYVNSEYDEDYPYTIIFNGTQRYQDTETITITITDITADTNKYFTYSSTTGIMKPRSGIDFSNKKFILDILSTDEPSADTSIAIKPNGTQPVFMTVTFNTTFTSNKYFFSVYDYYNILRLRMIVATNGTSVSYTSSAVQVFTTDFRTSFNINDSQPYNTRLL